MRRARVVLLSALIPATASAQSVSQETLRNASAKALELLVKQSPVFVKSGGCNSCHNQMLPAAAQAFARSRGVSAGTTIEQIPAEVSEATTERYVEYSISGGGGIGGLAYDLFQRVMTGQQADDRIHAEIHYLKGIQEKDGHWRGGRDERPPLVFDDFTVTAFTVHAITHYAPSVDRADTDVRIARARQWLTTAKAERTQERAFRLMGLVWSQADRRAVDAAIGELRALQHADGSWSQLATMPADAYATGMALYALSVGGVSGSDAGYKKGLRYLISTQAPDGTWHVKTRAIPLQPYFETPYPYDHDQWISAAGAAWATLAMSAAIDVPKISAR